VTFDCILLTVPHDKTSGATAVEIKVATFTGNRQDNCHWLENFQISQMTLKTQKAFQQEAHLLTFTDFQW
jgi:hypothetical protein